MRDFFPLLLFYLVVTQRKKNDLPIQFIHELSHVSYKIIFYEGIKLKVQIGKKYSQT